VQPLPQMDGVPGRMRQVRSFVLRGGRLTDGQKRALDELWPVYGVDTGPGVLDLPALFGNRNPVIVEIGFGKGESTWQMAQEQSGQNFLGVEVHLPGVGHLLLRLDEHRLQNVRIACADAVVFLRECLADASLAGVRLYFPDPWPKKRHHKRRIVQPAFMSLVASRLRVGGVLRMATDWQHYATQMLEVASACPLLANESAAGEYVPRPDSRPVTRFERRGQRLGHGTWDLSFRRS